MRHIKRDTVLRQIFANAKGQKAKKGLERAHQTAARKRSPKTRKKYIAQNGGRKWKPVKDLLTAQLGEKCWYTEHRLIGADLAIDHFRPVCHYWWLAFEAENYRLACPWANSGKYNALYGCAGGKGEEFPLLPPAIRATKRQELPNEQPMILDPCNKKDCALLAFQSDGRPILHPDFATDSVAKQRVEQSKILLNLDHPGFNAEREKLCQLIREDVRAHEALPLDSSERKMFRRGIEGRLNPKAPFSTAARFYLKIHRHLDWVEEILNLYLEEVDECAPDLG